MLTLSTFTQLFKKPVTYGAAESYDAYLRELATYVEHQAKYNAGTHENVFLCIATDRLLAYIPATKRVLYEQYEIKLHGTIQQVIYLQEAVDTGRAGYLPTLRNFLTTKYGVPATCTPKRLNMLRVRWLRELAEAHSDR